MTVGEWSGDRTEVTFTGGYWILHRSVVPDNIKDLAGGSMVTSFSLSYAGARHSVTAVL